MMDKLPSKDKWITTFTTENGTELSEPKIFTYMEICNLVVNYVTLTPKLLSCEEEKNSSLD